MKMNTKYLTRFQKEQMFMVIELTMLVIIIIVLPGTLKIFQKIVLIMVLDILINQKFIIVEMT